MKNLFKNLIFSVGAGFLFNQFQLLMGSSYMNTFLKQNLITLLVALVAINSATLGIVLTKIRELIDSSKNKNDFEKTKNEMILSIREQIGIIAISLILLIANDSIWIQNHSKCKAFIEVLIISSFFYAMIILYDTAKSVFVILEYDKSEK